MPAGRAKRVNNGTQIFERAACCVHGFMKTYWPATDMCCPPAVGQCAKQDFRDALLVRLQFVKYLLRMYAQSF